MLVRNIFSPKQEYDGFELKINQNQQVIVANFIDKYSCFYRNRSLKCCGIMYNSFHRKRYQSSCITMRSEGSRNWIILMFETIVSTAVKLFIIHWIKKIFLFNFHILLFVSIHSRHFYRPHQHIRLLSLTYIENSWLTMRVHEKIPELNFL
jgi:hypothetical protein